MNDHEMLSPSDMMIVDEDEDQGNIDQPNTDQTNIEKTTPDDDSVALIPEEVDDEELLQYPLANDFDAMKEATLLPLQDEQKILEEQSFTWKIEAWRTMSKKEHGPLFQAAGFPWRILLFPHGNNVDQVSIYLEHGFEPHAVPANWSCCINFAIVLWNPNDPSLYHHHCAHHRFTKEESDWGFTRFLELRRMFNIPWDGGTATRPICEGETANITAYLQVVEDETGVLWHNFNNYDSKKETGFVGLKNQGATCYLNSLLQSLYVTNAFRKAVYEIPTEQDPDIQSNSAYTLQRLFYQLQTSVAAVSTSELTKSFGWETRHIFEQQDVQELSRKLMERMEEKMKGTKLERLLPSMFSGKIKTYISCINVDYESSRVEDFWDLQLNVVGIGGLEESLQDYIQVEKMDGENQYFAGDEHKLQDANKGVIFLSFPDVLNLQLKRFGYDYHRDSMAKVYSRYEFPEVFDAAPYLSSDTDRTESWEYQLHGVLVHTGDVNAGHYYAFLKPEKTGWFFKFDDDRVTRATMREVLEENYGGETRPAATAPQAPKGSPLQKKAATAAVAAADTAAAAAATTPTTASMRPNSAYMLVYIRRSRLDQILHPLTVDDIPIHLQKRIDEEIALKEVRRREREDAHLYVVVKVVTEESFRYHNGTDLATFEAAESSLAAPKQFKIFRSCRVCEFVPVVAEALKQDPRRVRLWAMVNRQNRTIRPDAPIMDTKSTIEDTFQRTGASRDGSLRLWAEVAEEVTPEGDAIWPTYQSQIGGMVVKNDLILLFLKYFDPVLQDLGGVGHIYVSRDKKVEELGPIIMKKMDWGEKLPNDEKILLWEEIKPSMIEALKGKQTLKTAELQDGDIICFQRGHDRKSDKHHQADKRNSAAATADSGQGEKDDATRTGRVDDVKDYYDFLVNKKTVKFVPHPTRCIPDKYPTFELVLSSKIGYDALAERVSQCLQGVPPTHLRFWTVNMTTGNPKTTVKRLPASPATLGAILHPTTFQPTPTQRSDALYFEVLEMSLAELDSNKNIRITWLSEGITKEFPVDLFVNKAGTTKDLIEVLVRKAEIPDEAVAGLIRAWEASNNKFVRELSRDCSVLNINEYATVYAERVPEEELGAEDNHFILAFHYQGEPSKVHGVPFKFLLKEDEEFSETKKRLEKRTGIKGKLFEKIKFTIVRRAQFSKPQDINDTDQLWEMTQSEDEFLGLDHHDRSRMHRNNFDLYVR